MRQSGVWSLSSVRTTNQQHTSQSGVQSNKPGYVDVPLCIYRRVCNHLAVSHYGSPHFSSCRNKVTSIFYTPVMTETKLSQHVYNTIITRQRARLLQQMVYIPTELR